jgi:hypothetical protein
MGHRRPILCDKAVKAAELALVESRAHDVTFSCWLWFGPAGLTHAYQADSSSKLPAPEDALKKTCETVVGDLLTKVVPYQDGLQPMLPSSG